MSWQIDKICKDINEYELVIERQKTQAPCEQRIERWKWIVSRHGAIIKSGVQHNLEKAKAQALEYAQAT